MNHELSNAYYLNQQYEEAERIILEKLDVYLNDETNFAFLTAVFWKVNLLFCYENFWVVQNYRLMLSNAH